MSDQAVGEIRIFAGNYAPEGWALCNGQTLSIQNYEVLYSLLGTTYGGDGVSNFGLPDLRSRIPLGVGKSGAGTTYALGVKGGTESVSLSLAQIPAHTHTLMANSSASTTASPGNNCLAVSVNSSGGTNADAHYVAASATVVETLLLSSNAISFAGSNASHANIMPSSCVNFIIALQGIYPQFPS